jgi:formylglycine-generating enzyme required for sulfatase activity
MIPAGCFLYGSPPTEPCRSANNEEQVYVTLTHPFLIQTTEVTQEQWEEMGFPNPSPSPTCADCPVSIVSWFDAIAYCNARSESEGLETCYDLSSCEGLVGSGFGAPEDDFVCAGEVQKFGNVYECPGYRLPTTAEWEYSARAGTTTETYAGDSPSDNVEDCQPDPVVDEIAWSCSNTDMAMAVGLKTPNGWGLYDMLGNIGEWASDPYQNVPLGGGAGSVIDPHGFVESSSGRPVRGGVWMNDPVCVKSAFISSSSIDGKLSGRGFRPARTLFE